MVEVAQSYKNMFWESVYQKHWMHLFDIERPFFFWDPSLNLHRRIWKITCCNSYNLCRHAINSSLDLSVSQMTMWVHIALIQIVLIAYLSFLSSSETVSKVKICYSNYYTENHLWFPKYQRLSGSFPFNLVDIEYQCLSDNKL